MKNCGLMIEPQEGMKVQEIVDWAKYAEAKGYGYFFRSDHLLSLAERSDEQKAIDSPECWTTLGVIAAVTTRIKFGPLVSPVGFRNPALLARMACTLDSFSKGRMCLGLGAGWNEGEYKAHGYEFPSFKVRRKQVEEGYRVVRGMTEGRRFDFDGQYYSAHVDCYPRPAAGKVHLIGGGRNPKIVGTLAKYVDEWNVFNCPPEKFEKLKKILLGEASYRAIGISHMGSFLIADTQSKLDSRLKSFGETHGLGTNPDEIAKKMKEGGRFCGLREEFLSQVNKKVELGIQKFYFQILDPKDTEMVDQLTDTLKER